jgi:hypothetical protein
MDFDHPRLYSVRQALPDGTIETVGDFQQFKSSNEAHKAAERLAQGK